jgi:ketosteroid isomerase-like protein
MSVDDNKHIVQRALSALASGDLSPLGELLAPGCRIHQCGFLQPIPAERLLRGELPGASKLDERRIELLKMVGEGDTIAIHWSTAGSYRGHGAPELAGKQVTLPAMTFIRLNDGRIAEIWNIQDVATLDTQLQQLTGD